MRELAAEAFGTFCLVFAGSVVLNGTHGATFAIRYPGMEKIVSGMAIRSREEVKATPNHKGG